MHIAHLPVAATTDNIVPGKIRGFRSFIAAAATTGTSVGHPKSHAGFLSSFSPLKEGKGVTELYFVARRSGNVTPCFSATKLDSNSKHR